MFLKNSAHSAEIHETHLGLLGPKHTETELLGYKETTAANHNKEKSCRVTFRIAKYDI